MRKELFNSNWQVWEDKIPFELVSGVPPFALEVDLPDDAMFREKQSPQSINGGATGYLDGSAYKYHKSFLRHRISQIPSHLLRIYYDILLFYP